MKDIIMPNYSDEKIIKGKKSIFLAGPTPRDEKVVSWREDALQYLKELGFDGVVYIPEFSTRKPKDDYMDQAMWEREALTEASVILFWVPRELETMPAFTTNVEFGYWINRNKIIYGRPANAPKINYLDWLYGIEYNEKPYDDLRGLLARGIVIAEKMFLLKSKTTALKDLIGLVIDNPTVFYSRIAECLTPQERLFIASTLVNKSCMTCVNGSCRVEHHEKIGLDENGKPQGYDCLGWENDKYVGKSKVLQINDIYSLK